MSGSLAQRSDRARTSRCGGYPLRGCSGRSVAAGLQPGRNRAARHECRGAGLHRDADVAVQNYSATRASCCADVQYDTDAALRIRSVCRIFTPRCVTLPSPFAKVVPSGASVSVPSPKTIWIDAVGQPRRPPGHLSTGCNACQRCSGNLTVTHLVDVTPRGGYISTEPVALRRGLDNEKGGT